MGLKIIGVKTHDLSKIGNMERDAAQSIYKAISEDTFYPLYAGYSLDGEYLMDAPDSVNIYNEDKDITQINISAIVGANGSGKSSLIELIMRVINNFACYCIGEFKINNAAEHLTYVDNVYATLLFSKNNQPFSLIVKGRSVSLHEKNNIIYHFETISDSNTPIPAYKTTYASTRNDILENLFYTIVNNFSLYSYNTNDYENEYCPEQRIHSIVTASTHPEDDINIIPKLELKRKFEEYSKILKEKSSSINLTSLDRVTQFMQEQDLKSRVKLYGNEGAAMISKLNDDSIVEDTSEQCWLKGIFHKNDGYTVPIVITPFRDKGIIDVSQENYLAVQRFLFLLLYKDAKAEFPFRKIDNTLYAEKIEITLYEDDNANLAKTMLRFNLSVQGIKKYIEINELIFNCWEKALGIEDLSSIKSKPWYNSLKNYITYKTIKIAYNYSSYSKFMDRLKLVINQKIEINKLDIDSHIEQIIKNPSHITQKLRQSLSFLKFRHIDYDKELALDDLFNNIENNVLLSGKNLFKTCDYAISKWDLLPPPIFSINFLLSNGGSQPNIKFITLSSGQRQLIYFKSSVLYHLINLNSAFTDKETNRPRYQNVCMIFEEVELYFHPELQRKLVKELIDSIRLVNIDNVTGIQMIFITHSPFILSDIPKTNCLFLKKNGLPAQHDSMQTFGANIFDILNSSFFLENGIIGEFAARKIESIIRNEHYDEKDIEIANEICDVAIRRFVLSEISAKKIKHGNLIQKIKQLEDENKRLRQTLNTDNKNSVN